MILTYKGKSPVIHPDCYVAPTADIIGNVSIDKDSSVWFGCVIRSDLEKITIGQGTSVQDNCTLHADQGLPCEIGDHVTIGHNAVVHGCQIGDNTVIGMHSTILNGAKIGKGCLIAAGAVVKENAQIPDRSLVVGVPGKVIRTLDEAAEEKQLANALEYVELSKNYKA